MLRFSSVLYPCSVLIWNSEDGAMPSVLLPWLKGSGGLIAVDRITAGSIKDSGVGETLSWKLKWFSSGKILPAATTIKPHPPRNGGDGVVCLTQDTRRTLRQARRQGSRVFLLYFIKKMSCVWFESPKQLSGLSHLHLFKLELFFPKGKSETPLESHCWIQRTLIWAFKDSRMSSENLAVRERHCVLVCVCLCVGAHTRGYTGLDHAVSGLFLDAPHPSSVMWGDCPTRFLCVFLSDSDCHWPSEFKLLTDTKEQFTYFG